MMRKVVNITSISGIDGIAGQAGYGSGKAGINGLTKVMAKEWGRYNVNVNSVGFGLIETRLVQPLSENATIDMKGHKIRSAIQQASRERSQRIVRWAARERRKKRREQCCSSARRYRITSAARR